MTVIFTSDRAPQIRKFGRNPDVDAAEDIVDYGGEANFPSAEGALTIESTNAADDFGTGANAKTVDVAYLDGDGMIQEETGVQLDGTNPVTVAASALFCYRFRCVTFGANKTNAGQIIAKVGSDIVATAPIGFNQTQVAAMVVPADYTSGFIKYWKTYTVRVSTVTGEVGLMVQEPGEEGFAVRRTLPLRGDIQKEIFDDNDMLEIPKLSNVKLRVLEISAVNTIVAGSFLMRFK